MSFAFDVAQFEQTRATVARNDRSSPPSNLCQPQRKFGPSGRCAKVLFRRQTPRRALRVGTSVLDRTDRLSSSGGPDNAKSCRVEFPRRWRGLLRSGEPPRAETFHPQAGLEFPALWRPSVSHCGWRRRARTACGLYGCSRRCCPSPCHRTGAAGCSTTDGRRCGKRSFSAVLQAQARTRCAVHRMFCA